MKNLSLAERKAMLTKGIDVLKFRYNGTLELAIEGRFTNLQIWVGNEKCLAEGGGKLLVYMRIDKGAQYNVPFEKDNIRLQSSHKAINALSEKYGFTNDIECLNDILEITKDMKCRQSISW